MRFLLTIALISYGARAANQEHPLPKILQNCYPSTKLKEELKLDLEMKRKIQIPDLRVALSSGYSNNEISQSNPERMQVGLGLRWNDVTDNQRRNELINSQIGVRKDESKLIIEEYWRAHLEDFYYWKWGRSLRPLIEKFHEFTEKKIILAEESFKYVASTRLYSDIIELNKQSSDFLSKIDVLNDDFNRCKSLENWKEKLDYDRNESMALSKNKSPRLSLQKSFCENQKKIKTIMVEKESGAWGLALGASINRNRQLGEDGNNFNDVRVGLELSIPLNLSSPYKVTIDRCDYDLKINDQLDSAEMASSTLLYPVLESLEKQFRMIKKNTEIFDLNSSTSSVSGQEVVLLGLNLIRIHKLISEGETKMNVRFIPSKIAEHEF